MAKTMVTSQRFAKGKGGVLRTDWTALPKTGYDKWGSRMSPTVFRYKGYRFFFFSREEVRMHVHVACSEGEAKFWLEPTVALATFAGLDARSLNELQKIVEQRKNEIKKAWKTHFKS